MKSNLILTESFQRKLQLLIASTFYLGARYHFNREEMPTDLLNNQRKHQTAITQLISFTGWL
jgi:hypothetical protein